jgi:hypothetical protein
METPLYVQLIVPTVLPLRKLTTTTRHVVADVVVCESVLVPETFELSVNVEVVPTMSGVRGPTIIKDAIIPDIR